MRSPLSVPAQPIGIPCLILKVAIAFFALVTRAFCPEIVAISAREASKAFELDAASPRPLFKVTFCTLGTW